MSTTIKEIAKEKGLQPDTLRRKVAAEFGLRIGINDELSERIESWLQEQEYRPRKKNGKAVRKPPAKKQRPTPTYTTKPPSKPSGRKDAGSFARLLAILPLPMLGLAASYGVFYFAAFFVPTFVAIGEAAAFELTYIGLAMIQGLDDRQQKRASVVAKAAVWVSVVYNTLAGVMHQQPAWFDHMHPAAVWALALIHGVPLAVLAYQVANLLLHRKS